MHIFKFDFLEEFSQESFLFTAQPGMFGGSHMKCVCDRNRMNEILCFEWMHWNWRFGGFAAFSCAGRSILFYRNWACANCIGVIRVAASRLRLAAAARVVVFCLATLGLQIELESLHQRCSF